METLQYGEMQDFLEATTEDVAAVVNTNLLGGLLCTRAALRLLASQAKGGHVFNMDGAGADGLPTPQYAAYGATKAGIYPRTWRPCSSNPATRVCNVVFNNRVAIYSALHA